jgi:hypothetical protein
MSALEEAPSASHGSTRLLQDDMPVASGEDENPPLRTPCGLTYMSTLKLFVVALLVTGIVLGLTIGNLDSRLGDLLQWLEDNRIEGILIYIALYAGLTGAVTLRGLFVHHAF